MSSSPRAERCAASRCVWASNKGISLSASSRRITCSAVFIQKLLSSIGFCHHGIDVFGGGQMLPSTGTGGENRRCRRGKAQAIKDVLAARQRRGVGAMENVAASRGFEAFHARGEKVLNWRGGVEIIATLTAAGDGGAGPRTAAVHFLRGL